MMRSFVCCCLALFFLRPASAAEEVEVRAVDCHVHFWHLDRPEGIYWIPKDNQTLYRSFLRKDFSEVVKSNPVGGVVVVQAGQHIPDNQWNLDLTAHDQKLYRGVVGNLSTVIGSNEFAPLFEKLCQDKRYVGYRLSGRPSEGLSEEFFRDLELTAGKGRAVDFLLGGYSLSEIQVIAKRVPDLKIIINHLGGIVLDGNPLDPNWVKSFQAVAKCPNVLCKVSALYGRVKEQPAPQELDFYRPVLDLAFECFGEDRLVFGSDWPVTRMTGDYASVLALTRGYFEGKVEGVPGKVLSGNAMRFYGLESR
jgi:L-fuconolactonase